MSAPAVELRGVRLSRQGFALAADVAFPAGAISALIGPSGAGKTTLLDIIAGFCLPCQGELLIAGEDVTAAAPQHRPVSMIFQDHNLFAHLDVATNIALGLSPSARLSPAQRHRLDEALARVGLEGKGARLPGELSGGERQRVALARALVRERPVLLMDEPFTALGPALAADMAALIGDIHRERAMTVIFVTHRPVDVRRLASFAAFMAAGRIVATGAPEQLLARRDLAEIVDYLG